VANVTPENVIARVREIIDGDPLVVRPITAGTYEAALPPGLEDREAARRALVTPRYDVRLTGIEKHPAQPPNADSLALYTISIDVVVIRHIYMQRAINEAARDAYYASQATIDGDIIRQALEHRGNLYQVFATSSLTGLVGACLTYQGSTLVRFQMPGEGPGIIEHNHSFTGVLAIDR
jgi:hypothetical protein